MPSVIAVLVQSIVQVKNTYRAMKASKYRHDNQETCCFKMAKCSTEFLLGSTIIMNVAICLVFLPYMVTNSIPMIVGFCWLLLPLLAILTLVYALIITAFVSIISRCAMCDEGFCCRFFFTHCAVGLQVFGCLIISMAYNYSQYCYFGSGYLPAVVNEFQSRDTVVWAHSLVNDTTFQIHNILAFF